MLPHQLLWIIAILPVFDEYREISEIYHGIAVIQVTGRVPVGVLIGVKGIVGGDYTEYRLGARTIGGKAG